MINTNPFTETYAEKFKKAATRRPNRLLNKFETHKLATKLEI